MLINILLVALAIAMPLVVHFCGAWYLGRLNRMLRPVGAPIEPYVLYERPRVFLAFLGLELVAVIAGCATAYVATQSLFAPYLYCFGYMLLLTAHTAWLEKTEA
jgi:hypothetical protein